MSTVNRQITFVVQGEPASKANSRRIAVVHGSVRVIRSKKALLYADGFALQCPNLEKVFTGPVSVTLDMFYASRRPDLDESIVLDCMQSQYAKNPNTGEREVIASRIYLNDRQVKEKHVYWHLDKHNPRVQITVAELNEQN
jgi:hypothetical protein